MVGKVVYATTLLLVGDGPLNQVKLGHEREWCDFPKDNEVVPL